MDKMKAGRGLLAGVPKHARIKGQDHELIYATEDEQDVLVKRGGGRNPDGSQVYGPKGVKAFPEPGMGGGNDNGAGSESTGGSTGGGEGNSSTGGPTGSDGYGGGGVGNTDAESDMSEAQGPSGRSGAEATASEQNDAQAAENASQGQSEGMSGRDMFEVAVKAFTRFGMIGYAEDVGRKVEAELEERGVNVDTARADEYGGFTGTGTTDMPGDDTGGTGPGGSTDPMLASSTAPTATKRTDVQPSGFRGLLPQTSTRVGPNGLYI